MKSVGTWIKRLPSTEPALLLGFIVSALSWVIGVLNDAHQPLTWRTAAPIVLAALIRKFVYSPNTMTQLLSREVQRAVSQTQETQTTTPAKPTTVKKKTVKTKVTPTTAGE